MNTSGIKKFNLSLIRDEDGTYLIVDEDGNVLYEIESDTENGALKKFNEFGKILDSTNVEVSSLSLKG